MPNSRPARRILFPAPNLAPKSYKSESSREKPRLERVCVGIVLLLLAAPFSMLAEDELEIGRNSLGQLKVQVGFEQPFGLPVSVFPGWPGYATGEVGFHSAAFDEPTNDFYQLSLASDLRFILLAKDPGMEVLNDHGSAYMNVGESFFVGQPAFDTHPLWDLVTGQIGGAYSLTLQFHDVNGIYSDSDPIVLSFTPEPPLLTIQKAAPGFVTISWPPEAPGLVLQFSPTLNSPTWTNAPSGTNNPATLSATTAAGYFRLGR